MLMFVGSLDPAPRSLATAQLLLSASLDTEDLALRGLEGLGLVLVEAEPAAAAAAGAGSRRLAAPANIALNLLPRLLEFFEPLLLDDLAVAALATEDARCDKRPRLKRLPKGSASAALRSAARIFSTASTSDSSNSRAAAPSASPPWAAAAAAAAARCSLFLESRSASPMRSSTGLLAAAAPWPPPSPSPDACGGGGGSVAPGGGCDGGSARAVWPASPEWSLALEAARVCWRCTRRPRRRKSWALMCQRRKVSSQCQPAARSEARLVKSAA
mmetsp:Transcript_147517/g.383563  ORF Transcript_147517/g.383563 Transcript_147517/m.383563 type:complete len:272 (+) Transcript_147517:309-1124(+)